MSVNLSRSQLRILLLVLWIAIAGCDRARNLQRPGPATATAAEPTRSSRETILLNMPTNKELRCVGISAVVAALLDGDELSGESCDDVDEVAQRIYDSLPQGERIRHTRQVMIDGKRVPIDSVAALDRLGILVSARYKTDFRRLMKTEEGRQRLLAAQHSVVPNSQKLDQILAADADKTDVFFGTGIREFTDKRFEDTDHAFLISKETNGKMVIYDPNDPGVPITCQVKNTDEGVLIEWTCQYRDTGNITSQIYFIVDKKTAFDAMLGE